MEKKRKCLGMQETGGKVFRGVYSPYYKAWWCKSDGLGHDGQIRRGSLTAVDGRLNSHPT